MLYNRYIQTDETEWILLKTFIITVKTTTFPDINSFSIFNNGASGYIHIYIYVYILNPQINSKKLLLWQWIGNLILLGYWSNVYSGRQYFILKSHQPHYIFWRGFIYTPRKFCAENDPFKVIVCLLVNSHLLKKYFLKG